jgi:mono/diheme cytochrome c family protein
MRLSRSLGCLPIACLLIAGQTGATANAVDYLRDVKPIFQQRCYACHGSLKQEGGLRVDTAEQILRGGDSGAAVISGDAHASYLLERVTDPDEATRMPQDGPPLTAAEVATIAAWIEAGPAPVVGEPPEPDPRDHWAFRLPLRPDVPQVESAAMSIRNPIDAFVADAHRQHRLQPVAEVDKPALLRRVTLDLIGLPPTREQLKEFLADDAPDAYERLVDRLLDSPQYGERWGRHWMDVWRYSDWYGRRNVPDVMNSYPTIWRWRDWIVNSLNEDKGYDRMIVEMLAGDEVAPEDDSVIVATGFLVRNWFKWNYGQWMKDNVEHTGKAFLALTFNCAHCHDHKYDPFSQRDYFAMRAFFEPLDLRQDRMPGEPDPGKFQDYVYGAAYGPITGGMIRVYDRRLDAKTRMYARGDERNIMADEPPVEPGLPEFLNFEIPPVRAIELPPVAVYPGLKPFVAEEELTKAAAAIDAAQARLLEAATAGETIAKAAAEAEVTSAEHELAALTARIAAGKARFEHAGSAAELAREAVQAERTAAADKSLAAFKAAELALAKLQAQQAPADQISAAQMQLDAARQAADAASAAAQAVSTGDTGDEDFTLLTPTYPAMSTGRRTALALAIASRKNPLTARVAVNHIWMRHFGPPLVESVFDFGRSGKAPTHPELLDWLAVEFVESGWSMKHVHRLMVKSTTYRLDTKAAVDSPNRTIDPENRLLWRFNRTRMEAEVVRDSLLFAAGQLDLTRGGPEIEIKDAAGCRRRSLYLSHYGEAMSPLMSTFDGANPDECYRRSESVVPQQALALANGDLAVETSRVTARQLWDALAGEKNRLVNDTTFIEAAYQHLLSRFPSPEELAASLTLLEQQRAVYQADSAGEGPAADDGGRPSLDAAMRARESLCHALLSHHDFISIR